MYRIILLSAWLMFLFVLASTLFWYNDWVYRMPTPVPAYYKSVSTGTKIDLSTQVNAPKGKPLFIHFYNPACPCSRFNKNHFQSLVHTYGKSIHFVVVVLSDEQYTRQYIQEKIGLNIPVLFDRSIAARCGVYSTPQAALIDTNQQLYYRGNYNASGYCSDKKTAYAKMAIDSLMQSRAILKWDQLALKAYGCTIPVCYK
ncbi:DUF6436 domain-containing protein [Dyadobacter sediminis]|uniref:Redoxin domain-containing protein n=1 Tax=Dyadobacter sediminis TaxID=1493691 RepID=A0A5R9KIM2_9BACT|nr:redoxin domain-containing protein [Dyadobacter sediminis]TLU96055.1 redoxin domain-containing protein [Dyadobacter sediminis]GGB78864.1 hypothetical protein GCM10011325_03010 [Dyadobacter sediminis]